MKRRILSFLILSLSACSLAPQKAIFGVWDYTYSEFQFKTGIESKREDVFNGLEFNIKSDGTYTVKYDMKGIKGTFSYLEEKRLILMYAENNKSIDTITVRLVTDTSMDLKLKNYNASLHFKKRK